MRVVAVGQAAELGLADAVPRPGVPALGASLGGVTGVDCDHLPPGAFSLGGKDAQEDAPSRVVDGLVQAGLGGRAVGLVAAVAVRAWPGPAVMLVSVRTDPGPLP